MNDKRFFDTNLVVYLYSQDEPDKQSIAKNLLKNSTPIISTQASVGCVPRTFLSESGFTEFKNFQNKT